MYNNYANHSMCGLSLKHNSLPILAQTEFDFCRYVTFTDDMYGKTVSELHRGNLRTLTHSHPLRSGILALCNKRWLEVFLRNRVEFTAVFELTLDLLNYGLSPFVQQFQ